MNRLVALVARVGAGPVGLCCVWLALACAYGCLALQARGGLSTHLPRAGFRIPLNRNIPVGNLRLQELINDLAQKHDATVTQLEASIRNSARTSFHVHAAAALLSLFGFAVQCTRIRWIWISRDELGVRAPRRPKWRVWPEAESAAREPAAEKAHNGSFPEGGYAG